jgi:hypothetical protein
MSTLRADTIQNTSGGAVTLTKQSAAKVLFCMNLSTTFLTVPNNSLSTQTLNVSSGTDAGTGLARGNLTNAMNALDYIWAEGIKAANNTANLDVGVATTSLIPFQMHDADTSSDTDQLSCATVFGDLA